MSRVEVQVGGKAYTIGCDTGEEDRIRELAAYLQSKVMEVSGGKPNPNDPSLLILASLILADEVADLRASRRAQEGAGMTEAEGAVVLSALKHLEKRMDGLAAKLKQE